MDTCIRNNLSSRFAAAGHVTVHLSGSTTVPSPEEPHIPILATANLPLASRILLYFGESSQDLGIFAYRTVGKCSLASGSILDFVSASNAYAASPLAGGQTAIVIANLGQLLWYRRGTRALTRTSWSALPRKTGVDSMMRIDPVKNRVKGHKTEAEHVGSVMAYVQGQMKKGAEMEIVGVGDGAEEIVRFLDANWEQSGNSIAAVCVGLGYRWKFAEMVKDQGFREFWGKVSTSSTYRLSMHMIDFIGACTLIILYVPRSAPGHTSSTANP